LGATVTDAAGHSISASVTWVSQNSSILLASDQGIGLGTYLGRINGVSTGVPSTTPSATVEVWVRAAGALTIVPVTVYRAVATALITPATYTLHPGEHVQLAATLQDASGNTVPTAATSIDWSALDPGTATIDQFGLVTAVAVNATPARIRVQSTDGSTTLANITVANVPAGGVPTGIVLLPTGTVHLGVGASQVFTAYLVDAQGNRTAPAAGFAIGMLTDVSGVAQAFNSSFSTTQLWQTATVQGLGVGTTPLRAFYYNTVDGTSTFSAFTTITVP